MELAGDGDLKRHIENAEIIQIKITALCYWPLPDMSAAQTPLGSRVVVKFAVGGLGLDGNTRIRRHVGRFVL